MLFYTGLIFLVIAVSLDGFGVGVTYGIRKTRVPFIALFIIMLCSGVIVLLSMTIGNVLGTFITPHIAKVLGGIILVSLGIFSLFNIIRPESSPDKTDQLVLKENKKFHDFKRVLSAPDKADLDYSGIITANEAFLLGLALALDAFGAGIGASMLGYSPILTTISIAFMSGLFLFCGIRVGFFISQNKQLQQMTFVPPLLLIALGISNIM